MKHTNKKSTKIVLAIALLALLLPSVNAETLDEFKASLLTSGRCQSVGVIGDDYELSKVDVASGTLTKTVTQMRANLHVVENTAWGTATTKIRILVTDYNGNAESCIEDATPVALTSAEKERLLFSWLAQKQAAGYTVEIVDGKNLGVFGAAVFLRVTNDKGESVTQAVKAYGGALQFLPVYVAP